VKAEKKLKVHVPKSTEETRSSRETVSSSPNKGAVVDAQPTGGVDSRVSPEESTGPDAGSTVLSQFEPAPHADPVRVQHEQKDLTAGRYVHSADHAVTGPKTKQELKAEDDAKVATFTRGGEDRVAYPGVSDRDFNSKSSNAPNTEQD
jgi:hypothetical protein